MKLTSLKLGILFVLLFGLFVLSSCDKDPEDFIKEQFPELDHTSSDILINGEIAVPILNTSFTLQNFIPSNDSSLWAEIDPNTNLVHLRMYFRDIASATAAEIYGNPVPQPIVPANSMSFGTDTSKLKVYQNALSGHLFFNNPIFKFIVINEIPIVSFFRLDTLRLIGLDTSTNADTTYYSNTNHHINAPVNEFDVDTTTITIDKTVYPGFEDFFSPIPRFTSFNITVGSEGNQTLPPTFPIIKGDEKISLDVDIDLPLDAHLKDLKMGQTIPFSFDSLETIEQIDSIIFKLILDNEFPVGGNLQVSFADTNNNGTIDDTIMTMFPGDGWEFKTSITNGSGETTSAVRSQMTLILDQAQLSTLKKYHASQIIIESVLNSYQSSTGQDIKIFGRYKLGIKMGFKISYHGNTGDVPQ